MMPDYPLGETLDFKFTSRQFSTGAPFTLSSPVIEVYEDNDIVQIIAGETITADFDGVTGLNNLRIVATGGNGYEVGKSYAAVISAGTVDSVSVVGEVVAQFTIGRSTSAIDLANATDGLTALRTLLLDIPTVSEFDARTILSANYFDPAVDAVANVTLAATVTNLTNLPSIPANWLTAAGINAAALDGKGNWNVGKTGYSLTQVFPTNFADLAIVVTSGRVDININNDKTGYSIIGSITNLDGLENVSVANLKAQADLALTDIHLDHLLAVDYDPAIPPGVVTALLNEIIESNAGVSRFTVAALDQVSAIPLTELGADPGANPTLEGAMLLGYMALRNKRDTTATSDEIHNNAGAVILTATLSDDTTTFSKTKYV